MKTLYDIMIKFQKEMDEIGYTVDTILVNRDASVQEFFPFMACSAKDDVAV